MTSGDSETRLKSVVDTMLDGLITIDAKGLVQDFNKAAERIFGYRADEVQGRNINMLMPEPYHAEHDGYLDNYQKTGDAKVIGIGREVIGKRKDGSTFHMHLSVGKMEVAGQLMYSGIVRDINVQKRAAENTTRRAAALENLYDIAARSELSLKEKFLAALALGSEHFSMPVGFITRVDGDVCRLEYALGPPGSPTPGAEMPLASTPCEKVWRSARSVGMTDIAGEDRCYRDYGLRSYLGAPLFVGGQMYGSLSFASIESRDEDFGPGDLAIAHSFAEWVGNEITRDVTQAELSERAERMRSILDTVADGIITSNSDGLIESFNPAAERIFGYDASEVIGKNIRLLVTGTLVKKDVETILQNVVGDASAGHAAGQEITGCRKYGVAFPMEVAVSKMNMKGQLMFTAIMRDITERKKVERLKNQFVSTVSHELRTPLTSIRGALGVVLGKEAASLSAKAKKMLETANRNSERLTLLINDILDLEKIEAGEMMFDLKPLDIYEVARRAIEENESYANSYKVNLTLKGSLSKPVFVQGDEHRLLQVFANFLSNAAKYSPVDGTVNIEVKLFNDRVRVFVCDQGPGIPEIFRSEIFGRFAQADSSDTREKGGTGLGLAISKAIIEQHEGLIGFTSVVDVGSEFYFELPRWQEVTLSESREDLPRVLICEDNKDIAYILSNLMEENGLISDIAATGAAAKKLISENNYRLILLDLMLPDADGITLLRELREAEVSSDLPVIVVSANADEGLARSGDDGVSVIDWLQKPIDSRRLSQSLVRALQGDVRYRVLHVEDDRDVIQVVAEMVEGFCDYDYATTLAEARDCLEKERYDLVILDMSLPDGNGCDLLDDLADKVSVVVFSGEDAAVDIAGQVDAALTKARVSNDQLIATVMRVLNQRGAIQ